MKAKKPELPDYIDRLIEVGDEIRTEHSIKSERALALSLNTDPSLFAKIIKGERPLSKPLIDTLFLKYGINPKWINFGQEPKYLKKVFPPSQNDQDYQDKYIKLLEEWKNRDQINLNDVLEKLKAIELGVDEIKQFLLDPQKGTVQVVSYQKKKDK